jgi:beta-phosphoglucomutase family hydrolase
MSVTQAVLWDMDGTLVDSENFHWIAWQDTMMSEHVAITHEQFLSTFGQRNDSILHQWLGTAATPARIESIASAKEVIYRQLVRKNGISALPGALEWVRRLHEQGWLQAVASAAPRANVEVVLETLGIAHYFQSIAAAEDVHRGKPDPEVYLTAASRLGVSSHSCIVVEDADAGIEAARRAGMRSIGVSRDGKHLAANVVVQALNLLNMDAFEALLQDNSFCASGA